MKKLLIITIGLIFTIFPAEAKKNIPITNYGSIEFTEQGVDFTLFLDGTFEFSLNKYSYQKNRHPQNTYRLKITKDYTGRIRTIGTVLIDYDRFGRLVYIGKVPIGFNNRKIISIGDLEIHYNHFGDAFISGSVFTKKRPIFRCELPKIHHHKYSLPKRNSRYLKKKAKYQSRGVVIKRKISKHNRKSRRL